MAQPQQQHIQSGLIAAALLAIVSRNIIDFLDVQRDLRAASNKVTAPRTWLIHATAALVTQTFMYVCGLAFFALQLTFSVYAAHAAGILLITVKLIHVGVLWLTRRAFVTPVAKEETGEDHAA